MVLATAVRWGARAAVLRQRTHSAPTVDVAARRLCSVGGGGWKAPDGEEPTPDPDLDTIILFPGQGSQTVGMGRKLLDLPEARQLYTIASEILCYNLLKLCLEGPQEKLNQTIFCQPAVFVTSMAAAFRLRMENPTAIEQCTGVAGFSVGEIAALVFAGVMTFEEAVHLVRVRAEAMQRCCDVVSSGMLSVIFDDRSTRAQPLVAAAEIYCRDQLGMEAPVVAVASYLYPACRVIAGHSKALDFIQLHGAEYGVRRAVRLPVSGAFHTSLMRPAAWTVRNCVHRMKLERPQVPVFFNVDGDTAVGKGHIATNVRKQIYRPVRWEQSIIRMLQRPKGVPLPRAIEVGPGSQLTSMLRRCNLQAWNRCSKVEV